MFLATSCICCLYFYFTLSLVSSDGLGVLILREGKNPTNPSPETAICIPLLCDVEDAFSGKYNEYLEGSADLLDFL